MDDDDINDFDKSIKNEELDESYIKEKLDELAYECVIETILFIREYVYVNGMPIAETLTYDDIYKYFFIIN